MESEYRRRQRALWDEHLDQQTDIQLYFVAMAELTRLFPGEAPDEDRALFPRLAAGQVSPQSLEYRVAVATGLARKPPAVDPAPAGAAPGEGDAWRSIGGQQTHAGAEAPKKPAAPKDTSPSGPALAPGPALSPGPTLAPGQALSPGPAASPTPPAGESDAWRSVGGHVTAAGGLPTLAEGALVDKYRVEHLLGRGGMGQVWKAFDTVAERPVVLKVLPPELQGNEEEVARVKASFQRVHALHHQHICPLHDLGRHPRFGYYLVMKFIAGRSLSAYRREWLAKHGAFPRPELARLLRAVADALDHAHAHKVIHRDVKPQNVLVDASDQPQVIDFGLAAEIRASMTRVSQVRMDASGTYPYMAPEQWRGDFQDGAADQYALAVMAFELLAGRLPFDAPDAFVLRQCVLGEPPPALADQPDSVNAALARGLAKARGERFASCAAFVEALASAGDARAEPKGGAARDVPVVDTRSGGGASSPGFWQKTPAANDSEAKAAPPSATVEKPRGQRAVGNPVAAKSGGAARDGATRNSLGMPLALIPAGEFVRGSPPGVGRPDEHPNHRVKITKPFLLGVYPVRQCDYAWVMGRNPSYFAKTGGGAAEVAVLDTAAFPVESVSWDDAEEFCRKLSALPEEQAAGRVYRLPTEAEWEYACRAGTTSAFWFGDEISPREANVAVDSRLGGPPLGRVRQVGAYPPNAFGLYDTHGQVWEWCADAYEADAYSLAPRNDPRRAAGALARVLRGGCWADEAPDLIRAARRSSAAKTTRSRFHGFRVACDPRG